MAILVAEDTPVNAILLRNILERAGHAVILAEDGVEALEAIDANPSISLAAVDVHMPRLNGLDFVRRLRDREDTADLPVIFISSASEADTVRQAVELKSSGYILKPIVEPSRVLERVDSALADAPQLLVPDDRQRQLLRLGERAYASLLAAFASQVARVRDELREGGADPATLQGLRESSERVGAERLARRLGDLLAEESPTRENHETLLREVRALEDELSQRGVTLDPDSS